MSKWVVDIHGDIEGDYELIKKYEEPKADVLGKIRAEIEQERSFQRAIDEYDIATGLRKALEIVDKYKAESEVDNENSN